MAINLAVSSVIYPFFFFYVDKDPAIISTTVSLSNSHFNKEKGDIEETKKNALLRTGYGSIFARNSRTNRSLTDCYIGDDDIIRTKHSVDSRLWDPIDVGELKGHLFDLK